MSVTIDSVDSEGVGADIGLIPGDVILSVNERPVRDPLEWRYLIADDYVELEILRGDEEYFVEIEKDYDDALDIHVIGQGFKKCNNRCIFCFIDQNPRDVRKALLFKDEDFRLSFLYGNYVTLTNTPEEDLERIIEQRLSPMYVSVQATDPELRRQLLRNKRAPDILPIMKRLAEGGIEMHTQIVLMPGVNDGEHLDRTVADLASLYPSVASVCIVPVGLTKYRERLPKLEAFDGERARHVISWLSAVQKRFLDEFGERLVYISDEFFLLAGADIPDTDHYEMFPQIGNGVGMVRQFVDAFEDGFTSFVKESRGETPISVDLVTATMPATFITPMVDRLNSVVPEVHTTLHTVLNERYGHGITVSGLLCGRDILDALRQRDARGDVILLPPNCINDDELFLDDMSLEQFQAEMGIPVVVGEYDILTSIMNAREARDGTGRNRPDTLPLYGSDIRDEG